MGERDNKRVGVSKKGKLDDKVMARGVRAGDKDLDRAEEGVGLLRRGQTTRWAKWMRSTWTSWPSWAS